MPLQTCLSTVDANGRELLEHGTARFPVACYHDDLLNMPVPWHWHDELEAAVVTEGRAIVCAGADKFIASAGDAFFVNAGVLHAMYSADGQNCRFHSLAFHPRLVGGSLESVFWQAYLNPLMENACLKGIWLRQAVPWMCSASAAIERAWQSCAHEPAGYEFQVRASLSELVFLLNANCQGAPSAHPSEKSLRDSGRIKQMLQFIQARHAEALNVAQIAESAAISESECLRCFRNTLGITPIQYLLQFRLQSAAALLQQTQLKITEIGLRCGFQETSYFARMFRRSYGCTPGEYRRQHAKDQ